MRLRVGRIAGEAEAQILKVHLLCIVHPEKVSYDNFFPFVRAGRAVGGPGTKSENYPCGVFLHRNYSKLNKI